MKTVFLHWGEYISQSHEVVIFVMESMGFYLKQANPLKIRLIAEFKLKNDDPRDHAKLLSND